MREVIRSLSPSSPVLFSSQSVFNDPFPPSHMERTGNSLSHRRNGPREDRAKLIENAHDALKSDAPARGKAMRARAAKASRLEPFKQGTGLTPPDLDNESERGHASSVGASSANKSAMVGRTSTTTDSCPKTTTPHALCLDPGPSSWLDPPLSAQCHCTGPPRSRFPA